MAVGTTIRQLREERGLSVERLAARAGLTRSTIDRVETGAASPRLVTLTAIADALEVPLAQLVTPEHAA